MEDCIASIRYIRPCKWRGKQQFSRCHRYEQSAINILLANYFDNDDRAYLMSEALPSLLTVKRGSRGRRHVSVCGKYATNIKSNNFSMERHQLV